MKRTEKLKIREERTIHFLVECCFGSSLHSLATSSTKKYEIESKSAKINETAKTSGNDSLGSEAAGL